MSGTLQKRLLQEVRLAGIASMEEAIGGIKGKLTPLIAPDPKIVAVGENDVSIRTWDRTPPDELADEHCGSQAPWQHHDASGTPCRN